MARYLISEAARQTGVEAHVLRFWEEELELEIPRNDQGHRYYTEEHIGIFNHIKEMKAQGFQLKAIRDSLARREKAATEAAATETAAAVAAAQVTSAGQTVTVAQAAAETSSDMCTEAVHRSVQTKPAGKKMTGLSHQDKLVEFESIVYDIVAEALRNNNERLGKEVSDRVGDKVIKEMNYLMRENEDHLEEHFRKLDEALTRRGRKAKADKEAAATKVTKLSVVSQTKKKRRLFPRKRKTTMY